MDDRTVQAVHIVAIGMLVLFQIDSVFPVNDDHTYAVGMIKGKAELGGDLLNVFLVDLIAKQQVIQIISRPLIVYIGLQNQLSDTLGNVHKGSTFPTYLKKRQGKLPCLLDHLFRYFLFVIYNRNSQTGYPQII